jgi:hypothetical protein
VSYDEKSDDSTFTRIIVRLDQQAKDTAAFRLELLAILKEVKAEVKTTNGRVNGLERWRDVITAKVAVISAATSFVMGGIAWAVDRFL